MKKNNFKFIVKCLLLAFIIVIFTSNFILADVGNFNSYDSGGSSYSSSYSSGSFGNDSESDLFTGIVLLIIVIVCIIYSKKNNKTNTNNNVTTHSEKVVNMIRKNDPNFSEEEFLAWTKDLFVKLQTAWTERNFESIRTFETKDLFEQHSRQLIIK